MRQCHEWTTQAYTFGIHVRHEKGRGAQGRVERAEGRKGWLKRAEGCKFLGAGRSAPLFWSSWNTVNKILGVDMQYTAKVKNLRNKFAQPCKHFHWNWIILCLHLILFSISCGTVDLYGLFIYFSLADHRATDFTLSKICGTPTKNRFPYLLTHYY